MSQNADILAHLKTGSTIEPLEALAQYGAFRLAARIFELRDGGWPIHVERVDFNGKRVASYSLYMDRTLWPTSIMT